MQVAVIEFARHVLGLQDADSSEFSPGGAHSVIDIMPDQRGVKMGGTMRLGAYPCRVLPGTRLRAAYGKDLVSERHRHRFEFNNDYRAAAENAGLRICGTSPDGSLVEAVEIPACDFFCGRAVPSRIQIAPPTRRTRSSASFVRAAKAHSQK